jgi:copper chaperone CopZ
VSVKASFIRNENGYKALIPKITALKCYNAIIKQLAENKVPEDMAINVDVNNSLYKTYIIMLTRFWDDCNNNRHVFNIVLGVYYQNGEIEVSHNVFDWLQAQKMDTKRAKKALGN